MGVMIWKEYMLTCDYEGCSSFVGYDETPSHAKAKDMYKIWKKKGWKRVVGYGMKGQWLCPQHQGQEEDS